MLKSVGVGEIYLPKIYPSDISFRSASVDFSEDASLTVPLDVLERLNCVNWYESASSEEWELASKYFDVCFFILHDIGVLKSAIDKFKGVMLWRAYGLDESLTYAKVLNILSQGVGKSWIQKLGRRFFFAQAYTHLKDIEPKFLSDRALYLPLGMHSVDFKDEWSGTEKRILFVCPDIAFNPYYARIYKDFISAFGAFPYAIGGAQPLEVDDPNVMGFVSAEVHARNMKEMRLMFYHSQEKYHIHYHPFEAVRSGMPLVFMAGGMLDRMGGEGLPGRCRTVEEAHKKIKRLLDGDSAFIEEVRAAQTVLLDAMRPSHLEADWHLGLRRIKDAVGSYLQEEKRRVIKTKRIAVVLPVAYRGGSLRGAKLLAEAIRHGSAQAGEPADVVFAHLESEGDYSEDDFSDLHPAIKRRTFKWKYLTAREARRAMRYAGHDDWEPAAERYSVIEDSIKQLLDCDVWLILSDRLTSPLLPLRPIGLMVYDYLQRYVPILNGVAGQSFLEAARAAKRVFVTTEFTYQDALQYGGVKPGKVIKLPMLSPNFSAYRLGTSSEKRDYFIWTTNAAPHKNHVKALQALHIYYQQLEGTLHCKITGVGTHQLLKAPPCHLKATSSALEDNKALTERLTWCGNLPNAEYQFLLSSAAFLWHPGSIDNGTFSVVEAASLGVPSLSSDYPAMREIDEQFTLGLAWMDASDALAMARALKEMELTYQARRKVIPSATTLASQDVHQLSGEYWKAVRECL